jgi:hypothetical protein
MAMDVLAIPATSVPIERDFSGLVDLITPNRANLTSDSIEIVHELKGFLTFGGNELLKETLGTI